MKTVGEMLYAKDSINQGKEEVLEALSVLVAGGRTLTGTHSIKVCKARPMPT